MKENRDNRAIGIVRDCLKLVEHDNKKYNHFIQNLNKLHNNMLLDSLTTSFTNLSNSTRYLFPITGKSTKRIEKRKKNILKCINLNIDFF